MIDKTVRRPIKWHYSERTDKGMVREVNEDAIISRADIGFWAVADGLGGHSVGDVASQMIIESLQEMESKEGLDDMVSCVEDHLIDINQRILEYADIMLDNATMGSTVVSLLIRGRVGVCLWVGDSRLYRYRNNQMQQLSRDHSQVEEWVQQGVLKPEEAHSHPQTNVITRAIGVDENIYVDMNVFGTQVGDTFLLCSDGLYNSVIKDDIKSCLSHSDADTCVTELMQQSLANGARDNVSITVIKGGMGKI